MQIGIDLGATKIEYVLIDNDSKELIRNRVRTPNTYNLTISEIISIVKNLEDKNKGLNIGICHPGATDKTTGIIKNAHNSQWLNGKNIVKDLKTKINNNIFSENDANCFCLSEAYDGSASHYESVFGIILGTGCGGGFVVNKKIIAGSKGLGGEWSRNQVAEKDIPNLKDEKIIYLSNRMKLMSFSNVFLSISIFLIRISIL